MGKLFLIIFLIAILNSCSEKKQVVKKHFDTFEISFSDGWITRFSFLIDSNKNYFERPVSFDGYFANGIVKGKLADSTFEIVNELVNRIKTDTSIQTKEIFCFDCPKMAISINSNNHSYDLHQLGKIDTIFNELINQFEQIDAIKEGTILDTVIDFKTKYWTNPLPPLNTPVKFQKPKNK